MKIYFSGEHGDPKAIYVPMVISSGDAEPGLAQPFRGPLFGITYGALSAPNDCAASLIRTCRANEIA